MFTPAEPISSSSVPVQIESVVKGAEVAELYVGIPSTAVKPARGKK